VNRTVALLRVKLQTMNEVFPADNVNLDVDEAHAIALYEPGGCGCSCFLGWRTACWPGCPRSARTSGIMGCAPLFILI